MTAVFCTISIETRLLSSTNPLSAAIPSRAKAPAILSSALCRPISSRKIITCPGRQTALGSRPALTGLPTAAVELARASAGKPYPHFTLSPSHFRPYLALAFCGWTPRVRSCTGVFGVRRL
jgi:hypothetical protein